MGSHRILDLVDSALGAYLVSKGVSTEEEIQVGKSLGDNVHPNTTCEAMSWAVPDGQEYTGNAVVSATVTVNTVAFTADGSETTASDSHSRVSDTFDCFYENDPQSLGDLITAAAVASGIQVTIIAARVTGGDRAIDNATWHDSINLELLACPSALT